jgi:hypothetical protein
MAQDIAMLFPQYPESRCENNPAKQVVFVATGPGCVQLRLIDCSNKLPARQAAAAPIAGHPATPVRQFFESDARHVANS